VLVCVDHHWIDVNIFFLCQSLLVKETAPSVCTSRTSYDLPDRSRKPLARRDEPRTKRVRNDDTHSNRRIIKRLRINRVKLRETKHDRDKRDPEHRGAGNHEREPAEMERPTHEAVRVQHAQRDRYPCASHSVSAIQCKKWEGPRAP
jgi:hypothetical protein